MYYSLQHKAMIVASDGCYEYHMQHQDVVDHGSNLAALDVSQSHVFCLISLTLLKYTYFVMLWRSNNVMKILCGHSCLLMPSQYSVYIFISNTNNANVCVFKYPTLYYKCFSVCVYIPPNVKYFPILQHKFARKLNKNLFCLEPGLNPHPLKLAKHLSTAQQRHNEWTCKLSL